MFIMQWVPGTYPIPFFQTWCCENSSITPSPGNWRDLKSASLPPKMYDCVRHNLLMNRVGVDCIHYLFNDDECRAFIAREYPSDVLDAYDNLIPTAFKADLWRYCVLYMYGGVYLDIKLQFCGGGVSLRSIVERWMGDGGDGGGGGDGLFVLERDAVGLWSPGRFGIHNAFIITKPKNPILLECIFRIVSASKVGGDGVGWGVTGAYDVGWMTRPLFVTGPGLLGDVWRWWRSRQSSGGGDGGDGDVPDSYATMAPYFRFFFEGDGRIGYLMDEGRYVQLLKVYDGYCDEYNHIAVHHVPHYTVLWSRGVVWGFRPPATGYCSAFAERSVAATLDRPKGASPRKT